MTTSDRLGRVLAQHRTLALAVSAGLAVAALASLYETGRMAGKASNQPAEPRVTASLFAGSSQPPESDYARLRSYAQMTPVPRKPRTKKAVPDVATMIGRLAARLEKQPNDADGWRMLGWSHFNTGDYKKAAEAYARAVALRADSSAFQSAYGEALVKAAGDVVTPQADGALNKALKQDPTDPRARYYKGHAKIQNGNRTAALDDWIALLKDKPPAEKWAAGLKRQILALARKTGVDVSGRLPKDETVPSSEKVAAAKGPTAEDVRRAQAMAPDERQAMIRGMVDGLAARLKDSPRDAEGWIRLIRSRSVLKEPEKARDALKRAIEIFADDAQLRQRIVAAAQAIGVTAE